MEALSLESVIAHGAATTAAGFRSRNSTRCPVRRIGFWTQGASRSRKQSRCATDSSTGSYTEDALDDFLQGMAGADEEKQFKDGKPPRLCTLRAFSEDGVGDVDEKVWGDTSTSVLFRPLAANVQASSQARNFETLSGRFSMVAFAVALGVEFVTGNGVFDGIELKQVGEVATAGAVSIVFMAVFLAAWGAKNRIGMDMTRGCQDLVEFALTDVLDAMFYEDEL